MDRPLRICMITTFYPPYSFGGDGIFIQRLVHALAERGHRVDVIHDLDSFHLLAPRMPTTPSPEPPGVTVHALKSPFGPLSPLATQQTGLPLFKAGRIRRVLEQGFDVIHYHNVSLVGGPGVLEHGRGVKLYTMHEYWLGCPTHVLFKFNREPCVRRSCFACTLSYARPPQWWRATGLLRRATREVDAFLAPSQFAADVHRRMGLAGRIECLPLFAPTPTEPAAALPEAADGVRPYFLFVGRLEKLKGLQTLLPIFRDYPRAGLVIAGQGSYGRELEELAAGSPNVRFLGHLGWPALQRLYREAVATIVPSICYEVFAQVILESFQQRTPVIVRNLGALPEPVQESGGGFVYDTAAQLRAALDCLLDAPAERDALGERGYATYQERWTADAHLRRYLALIEELMGGLPAAPGAPMASR